MPREATIKSVICHSSEAADRVGDMSEQTSQAVGNLGDGDRGHFCVG